MSHGFSVKDHVVHQRQGPLVDGSIRYTIVSLLPVESDGQYRYRIKCESEAFERIATEGELCRVT